MNTLEKIKGIPSEKKDNKKNWIISGEILGMIIVLAILVLSFRNDLKKSRGIDIDEKLELGQHYLEEMEYEQAVAEFTLVTEIDPYNEIANRALLRAASESGNYEVVTDAIERMAAATFSITEEELVLAENAYSETGQEDRMLGLYSMLYYTAEPVDYVVRKLVMAEAEQYHFDALENTLLDMKNKGIRSDAYTKDILNKYLQEGNKEAVGNLLSICTNNQISDSVVLAYDLYQIAEEADAYDEIALYLQDIENMNDILSEIGKDEMVYIGMHNEEGKGVGRGICFYGSEQTQDTRIYVGDFVDGMRSGDGIAYKNKEYYIICQWKDDLPNGEAYKYMYGEHSEGALKNGHISEPTTRYDRNGRIMYICGIPNASFSNGYCFAEGGNMSELYEDPCPEGHVYCWDCVEQKEERK